jgi:hypothetical protein
MSRKGHFAGIWKEEVIVYFAAYGMKAGVQYRRVTIASQPAAARDCLQEGKVSVE